MILFGVLYILSINAISIVIILIIIISKFYNITAISDFALYLLFLLIPVYILKDIRLKKLEIEQKNISEYEIPENFKSIIKTKPKNIKESYEAIDCLANNIDKFQKYDEDSINKLNERLALVQDKFLEKYNEVNQLYEKYLAETEKNKELYKFSELISGTKDLNKVYEFTAQKLFEDFTCRCAFILSIENKVFKLKVNKGTISDETVRNLEISNILAPILNEGKPVILQREYFEKLNYMINDVKEPIYNLICIPLITKNDSRAFGAIGIINNINGSDFSEDYEELINLIAIEVAISIKNIVYVSQLEVSYEETMTCLAQALEGRDKYTHGHVDRVRDLSVKLATKMGLPKEEIKMIKRAATLHDVGKIATPDNILHKQSKLTPEEWEIMKMHPEMSAKILEPISSLPREVIAMVRAHHERWDGNGYPHKLSRNAIPRGAQIISVADAFDALTTDRPYRKGLSYESALSKLKRESIGTQFDPEVISVFLVMMYDELVKIRKRKVKNESEEFPIVDGIIKME